jgi:DegV family protein with EDD domain
VLRIVTDSTADIPPAQQKQLGISIVPLNVHFGQDVYRDRVDLGGAEFFQRLKGASQLPRTSQPSVGAFEEVFRPFVSAGDEVVTIVLSARLSGTFNSATLAAQSVDSGRIDVIDSKTTSMAMGFLAMEAARLAREGSSKSQIVEMVNRLRDKAHILAGIDTLTYLEKGGRIGHARALLGSLLNVKPILTLKEGEVHPLGRARGRAQMLDRLVQFLEREGKLSQLAILHGAIEQDAAQLRERVAPRYPDLQILLAETGPVLGTHTGPGVIGFTYLVA